MRRSKTRFLKISLTPSQIAPVRTWIRRFTALEENWVEYPRLRKQTLSITANCFPFFMAYADVADANELDVRRLRREGERAIEARLLTELSPVARRSYEQALENSKTIRTGEFLFSDDTSHRGLMDLF